MSVEQTIDFSDYNTWVNISNTRYSYTLQVEGKDKNIQLLFSKNQFRELIEEFVNNDLIIIDEDGEIEVEV